MEINLEEKLKELENLQNDFKSKYEHISNAIKELKSNKTEIEKNKDFRKRFDQDSIYYIIDYSDGALSCELEDDYYSIDDNNFNNYNYFKTEKEALKYAKITQNNLKILQTLEYINDGWKPNWENVTDKYCINMDSNYIQEKKYYGFNQILPFQSAEKRQQFRELISDEEIKLFLNPLGGI